MPKHKNKQILIKELNATHETIMKLRADPARRNDLVSLRDIIKCFTFASDPAHEINMNDETEYRRAVAMLSSYVRKGYLRYTPKTKGGLGYSVNPLYLEGDNAVVTTVVDPNLNLASKLRPSYSSAMAFLSHLNSIAPSTSLSALMEFLGSSHGEPYIKVFHSAGVTSSGTVSIEPAKLKAIHLDHVSFGGENSCGLMHCDLWQAFQIGSALDTMPKHIGPSLSTTLSEPNDDDEGPSTAPF